MSATSVKMSATYEGRPLDELSKLIAARAQYLKGETTENAVTATAINIVSSLKGETKTAKAKAKTSDYRVTMIDANGAGWRGKPARRKATINGHWDRSIFPVNLMHGLKGNGYLYRIELTNEEIVPKSSKNKPVYYVLAPNETVAVNYAKSRVERVLKKERGIARYALGVAQAKIYSRPNADAVSKPTGAKAWRVAHDAAIISTSGRGYSSGSFGMHVVDQLRYSALALKGGESALELAYKKAANRTASIINRLGAAKLTEKIPTPFPEVVKSKASK